MGISALGATLCALIGAGSAAAATITVGSPLTAAFTQAKFNAVATVMNTVLPEPGTHVTSPVTGTIIRWRVLDGAGGPLYLIVATPNSGGTYTGTKLSPGKVPASAATQTFTANLPIKKGQTIGLTPSSGNDMLGIAMPPGAFAAVFEPPLEAGATASPLGSGNAEVAFNADVRPVPKVTHLSPHSGSTKGGQKVTIKGQNFDGTTKVLFGKKAAKSFKVISDTKIKAVAPAHHAGTVRVTVLNPGRSAKVKANKFKFKP